MPLPPARSGGARRVPGERPWPRSRAVLALAALAVAGAPLRGHDLWLVPSSFAPEPGAKVSVRILVGDGPGEGRPLAPRPGWIERFVVAGPGGEAPVAAVPGRDPAGYAGLGEPGVYALGLESGDTLHTLSAERFARFLAEEGLEEAVAGRIGGGPGARAGSPAPAGFVRELFSRSVKCLLRVPGAPEGGAGSALGLELELVPLSDPFDRGAPELALRVLRRGEPAAGVLVEAVRLSGGAPASRAVSDREGAVRLRLSGVEAAGDEGAGGWLVTAVALEPAPPGADADWRSLWSSLTFER